MHYSSGNYEAFVRPRKPEGADKKTAWFVGSGLAGLAGAAFLIRDGDRPLFSWPSRNPPRTLTSTVPSALVLTTVTGVQSLPRPTTCASPRSPWPSRARTARPTRRRGARRASARPRSSARATRSTRTRSTRARAASCTRTSRPSRSARTWSPSARSARARRRSTARSSGFEGPCARRSSRVSRPCWTHRAWRSRPRSGRPTRASEPSRRCFCPRSSRARITKAGAPGSRDDEMIINNY